MSEALLTWSLSVQDDRYQYYVDVHGGTAGYERIAKLGQPQPLLPTSELHIRDEMRSFRGFVRSGIVQKRRCL